MIGRGIADTASAWRARLIAETAPAQEDDLTDTALPLDVWHWVLVIIPIVVLLFLYVGRRWAGPEAAPIGLALSVIIAATFFQTPWETLSVAGAKGIWDALPIILVVVAALILYRVGTAAGAFVSIRRGVERYSKNRVFLVLAFGWIFASFAQGIVGFGTPMVIVAPILLALGVKPLYAVLVALIGHSWANFFGTLGVGWLATEQVVELEDTAMTAVLTALVLLIPIAASGLGIAWMVGRGRAVVHALPFIGVQTLVLGGVQLGVVFFSPELSTFLAGSAALLMLLVLARWKRYSEPVELENTPALEEEADSEEDAEDEAKPVMSLWMALTPYGILTVLSVAVLLIPPVESFLGRLAFALPFAETTTGYDVVIDAEDAYAPYTPLTHPSGLLLLAVLATLLIYRSRGYFAKWRDRSDPPPVLRTALSDGAPAIASIVVFLVLASVMSHSGQVDVLALGIAQVTAPLVYAFATPLVGVVGALVTSSSTSSNILFAPLQDAVSRSLDLPQAAVLAGQNAGGSIGNVVAPVNLTLGASAVGIAGQEGSLLRIAALWMVPVAILVGIATMLFTLI
ncbi:L-lactate permease [Leucobacter sp. CSA1]|uniref:L-lactate permease n=1 Tax=Leucobacter chromiisoli TaxID=2796471 RepID=A0A934Q6E4_9MICO|nr:L-lactate permease [Leucobacter chromiisoli]MBK0418526.1 L-lactate permease [Leucobacter chromiisoli]